MNGVTFSGAIARLVVGIAGVLAIVATGVAQEDLVLRGPNQESVRAVVIGIDAYRHVRPLKGAVADAEDLRGSLVRMGVTDVTMLLDDQASRASVLGAIRSLQQRTVAGDLVILAIAGHGVQEPERVKGSQPDGMDNVFLMAGFDPGSRTGATERIIGTEFNHLIKQFETRGARVLFIADACHGGGLAREVDPRAAEMSYRQVPRYRLAIDDLKPISTMADAFLTRLDFAKTAFLAAVDRYTKAPEIRIPGVEGYRGALSYAVARAIEGKADIDRDGRVTLYELFSNVRQVVYQLSDQRQNIVTYSAPDRDIKRDVAFVTRGVRILDTAPSVAKAVSTRPKGTLKIVDQPTAPTAHPEVAQRPALLPPTGLAKVDTPSAPPVQLAAVRIASVDGRATRLSELVPRTAKFEIVSPSAHPDLLWDPTSRDVIAGGDVIAYSVNKSDLPSVIDRMAAVQGFKRIATQSPQTIRTTPNDKLHRSKSRIEIEVSDVAGRAMVMFNIAGDGTVQTLYPIGSDPAIIRTAKYRFPVEVRTPYGADQIVVVTAQQRMTSLEQALQQLNQRRTAVEALNMVRRYSPADARIGTTGLFTAP